MTDTLHAAETRRTAAALPEPLPPPPRRRRLAKLDAVVVLSIYVFLLMLIPATETFPALGGLGTPATIFAVLALLWFTAGRLTRRFHLGPESSAPRKAMCVFGAAVLMAYLAAATRGAAYVEIQSADRDLILVTAWAGLVAIASAGITDYERLDTLLRRIVIGGSIVAALGIFEFATQINLVKFIQIPGLSANIADQGSQVRGDFFRPKATTSHPLEYGAVLAMLLPFALQQAFDPKRAGPKTKMKRWLPVILMASTMPLTVSRTAMVGVMIVLIVLVPTWEVKRRRPAYAVIVVGTGLIKVLVPGLLGTIVGLFTSAIGNNDASTQARTGDYAGVEPYIQARPIFGRGFGTFIPTLYRFTDNMYLLAMVELGAFGVFAIIVLYLTAMRSGRVGRKLSTDPARRELGQSFTATFGVALVTSATFDTMTFMMFSGLTFVLLGCVGSYLGIVRRERAEQSALAQEQEQAGPLV